VELSEEKRLVDNDIPDKIMMKVSTFPSMPQAGIKLRELFTREDVSIAEIEGILRQDPGLSANVLRLANSSYFGLRTKVGSLKHAVLLLGVKRFAQMAVSASMSKTMDKAVEGYDLSPGELWHHSIAVSETAENLAQYIKFSKTDDFYTPALLHDLGKLILGSFLKEERKEIENITTNGVSLDIAEKKVLGTTHAEIGALLLTEWSFPSDIVDAVRWHHNPEGTKISNRKSDIVYLANLMCQSHGDSDPDDGQFVKKPSKVLERLDIEVDQYMLMSEKVHSYMNGLSDRLTFD